MKMIPENNVKPGGGAMEVLLLRVSATDADEPGPNSMIQYSIAAGNPMGFFKINANTVTMLILPQHLSGRLFLSNRETCLP